MGTLPAAVRVFTLALAVTPSFAGASEPAPEPTSAPVVLAASESSDAAAAAPRAVTGGRTSDVPVRLAQGTATQAGVPQSLTQARRLAGELRYEEAVVEYQRYLGLSGRPVAEHAQATFELAFVSGVLGDDVTSKRLAMEALAENDDIRPPPQAPRKWNEFLTQMRTEFSAQVRVEFLPGDNESRPERVVLRLTDPKKRVWSVRLRHSLSTDGPFFATAMRCDDKNLCTGDIPPAKGANNFTSYYFAEALDVEQNTLAQAASPKSPLRVTVVQRNPWYESPWVWAGGSAALIAVAAAFFVTGPGR